MNDIDEYENIDEDFSALEDRPLENNLDIIDGEGVDITPDMPVYRLRLSYSRDTFLAIYRNGTLSPQSMVIVPTRFGKDLAQVLGCVRGKSPAPEKITCIDRPAVKEDLEKARHNQKLEENAYRTFREKVEMYKLDMKLVMVHYVLEEPKIVFFFTSDNRVDFRELVKDLMGFFKVRVELRQIGVRDEARMVGGLGVCGRAYCCHAVSDKLRPVSIKMAKDQNLSLNSIKISGPCGRLLCCLSYENNFYNEQQRLVPQAGTRITYENETWTVNEVNLISGQIKIVAAEGRQMTLPASRFERTDNRWRLKKQ
jgi:cell fate regulator YaaT (PSP1 superfamily)